MSEINVITATFGSQRKAMTMPIMYQHDVVQMLKIRGLDLPTYFEVEFCNDGDTTTVNITGSAAEGAQIPDSLIQTGRKIKAYIVLTYQDSVQTRYEITIPVYRRPLRNDIDPTDDQQLQIDALVAALNDAINRAEAVEDLLEGGDEDQILRKNSDDDLDFSWTDEAKEIFWATYGETTYSEVKAAYDANYLVLCEYNANIYLLTYWMGLNGPYFTFTAVTEENDGNYLKYLKLRGSGWSNGSIQIPHAEDVPTKTSDLTNDSGFITAEDVPEEIIEISGALNGTTITVASLGGKTVQDLVNAKEVILHTGDGTGMFCLHRANVVYYAVDLYILIFSGIVRGMLSTTDHMMTAVFSMVQGSATSMTGTFSDNSASIPSAATASPLMDGTAAVGSSSKYAKEDHVHPSDTSKITMPDGGSVGQVLKKTANGTEWANESGSGGTSDYSDLTNKPQINGNTLSGNKSASDLGLGTYSKPSGGIPASDLASGVIPTVPAAATDAPAMDGTAAVGTSTKYAKADHVHPSDTSRMTAAQVNAAINQSLQGLSPEDIGAEPAVEVVVIIDDGAVTQALYPDVIYEFAGTLTALTITLVAASAPAHYHFRFDSGSTAVSLTLPQTVTMPSGFQVEANKHYEIDILDGYGVAQSW